MTFEEEFKRPVIGPVTELNNTMQAVFRQYRAYREYTSELEKSNKGLKEKVLELENENSLLKDKNTQFDSYGIVMKPIIKPLPAIPQFVADYIKKCKEGDEWYGYAFSQDDGSDLDMYFADNANCEKFFAAIIYGYTVEKPQLFYLKNKRELEDVGADLIGYIALYLKKDMYYTTNKNRAGKFTQQEIDGMETGSYEQIEVAEEK